MSFDLKRQLIAQLVESSRLLRNYIDNRAKGRGTTRAQWIVLFRLRQQEGLSQVDLADVLELQPISLVRLLDRLVEHGLLERRHDPRDRRANRLFLTASGRPRRHQGADQGPCRASPRYRGQVSRLPGIRTLVALRRRRFRIEHFQTESSRDHITAHTSSGRRHRTYTQSAVLNG